LHLDWQNQNRTRSDDDHRANEDEACGHTKRSISHSVVFDPNQVDAC
jgi:hypothetical protein